MIFTAGFARLVLAASATAMVGAGCGAANVGDSLVPALAEATTPSARCVGQALTSNALDVDVPAVRFRGAVTLNGQTLPLGVGQRGTIVLMDRSRSTVASFRLGVEQAGTFDLRVARGTYEVRYVPDRCTLGQPMPCTQGVIERALTLTQDTTRNLDVLSVRTTLSLSVDGRAPELWRGGLQLVNELGESPSAMLDGSPIALSVWPGRYSLVYDALPVCAVDDRWPCNDGVVARDVDLSTARAHSIAIETSIATVAMKVNGALRPFAVEDRHEVHIVDDAKRRTTLRVVAPAPTLRARLLRGRYAAELHVLESSVCNASAVACNDGPIGTFSLTESEQPVTLSLETVTLSGRIRINDAAPVGAGVGHEGAVALIPGNGTVDVDADGRYSMPVVKRTRGALRFDSHALWCDGNQAIGTACGSAVFATEHEFVTDQTLDAALQANRIGVQLTIDGTPVTSDSRSTRTLGFVSTAGGSTFAIAPGRANSWSVIEGSYVVSAHGVEAVGACLEPGSLPCGTQRLATVEVRPNGVVALNIATRLLTGRLLFNGEPAMAEGRPSVALFSNGGRATIADLGGAPLAYRTRVLDAATIGLVSGLGQCTLDALAPGALCGTYWFAGCP